MNLKENVEHVKERISNAQLRSGNKNTVKIIAITKTHPPEIIIDVFNAGLTSIGENRIQEAEQKFPKLPKLQGIEKRLVGHLQSNKVNKALLLFDTIDSVDSLRLARKVGKKAVELDRTIPVLLEVNTSGEAAKFGFTSEAVEDMLACCEIPGINVDGLMTVGPLTRRVPDIRSSFISLRKLLEILNMQILEKSLKLTKLSMGMSGDFEIAVEEGATMVRLGTVLFGARQKY